MLVISSYRLSFNESISIADFSRQIDESISICGGTPWHWQLAAVDHDHDDHGENQIRLRIRGTGGCPRNNGFPPNNYVAIDVLGIRR